AHAPPHTAKSDESNGFHNTPSFPFLAGADVSLGNRPAPARLILHFLPSAAMTCFSDTAKLK
ncbi:MAG: hypothetical protein PHG76_07505, partial [Eubacteriales bacterium]|nr:hypothetical protein [Eubacteriales bacterium]